VPVKKGRCLRDIAGRLDAPRAESGDNQLGGRSAGGTDREAAVACARSYRRKMRDFSAMDVLNVWHARLDASDLLVVRPQDTPPESREFTMSLKGMVAIVTGRNSGIGQAIVLELARHGANIVIDYAAHPGATDALEQQVSKLGDGSIGIEADASRLADLQMLIDKAASAFGHLDIMVNNAGVESAHRYLTPPKTNTIG